MKKSLKRIQAWLVHPIAMGFYVTIVIVYMTLHYYKIASRSDEANAETGFTGALYKFHQLSIDGRLRWRGPRKVASNIALLAIDERAVTTVGRWPWSRELVAKAVDNAFKYGAKVIAFDITWSEPQPNPAIQVADELKISGVGPEITGILQNYAQRMDADQALGATFTKYADKIVAGSFYNSSFKKSWDDETEFCRDLTFKRSAAAKQWDHEEVLLSVNDPYLPYMPQSLLEFFKADLQKRENEVRTQGGVPKNKSDELRIENRVQTALYDKCDTILSDNREGLNRLWSTAVLSLENPKQFKFPTYDAWLDDYRDKSKANSIAYVEDWVQNTSEVAKGTKHTAYFNAEQDPDGTIRRNPLVVRTGNTYFPSLALKTYLVANGFNASPKLEFSPVSFVKEITDIEITNNDTGDVVGHIPTDFQGKLMINYAGPSKMFPHFSIADLLSDSPDAEIEQRVWVPETKHWDVKKIKVKKAQFIKDKIFIAGATATGIYDLRVTPFMENFPGTETHLNALENMVQKNFFHSMPLEYLKMPALLAVMGIVLSIALSFVGAIMGVVITAAALMATAFYDQYYLFNRGIVVSIIWPIFLILALYVTLTFYRYLTEERGKKELRQTFQKYVSPAIVEEILAHPANIELGGRKANLTVFFSDVRGFTTISEKLDPKALSDLLNSYLTPMTELVFKNRGTLDKYMGDAVMAFFGAPIAYNDHANWACRCALQSLVKLTELQAGYAKKGLPNIDIGIGLNTGDVNVGNMGSQTVRSYTVMGDAVNLASRLEGINKEYGTRIILSEFTYKEVKNNFVCREVDWVRVKGKVLPVKIFELVAEEKVQSAVAETLKWFQEGYEHYHAMAWQNGLDAFGKALNLTPSDEVAKLYLKRCQNYITEPPKEGWDGVFVMKTK